MRRWMLFVLALELLVMALVLVLPHVDLVDTAFKAGTTPIAARTRLTSSPFPRTAISTARISSTPQKAKPASEHSQLPGLEPFAETLRLLSFALLC